MLWNCRSLLGSSYNNIYFYTHTLVSNGVTSGRDWGGGRGGKESGSQAGPEFFGQISTICARDLALKIYDIYIT